MNITIIEILSKIVHFIRIQKLKIIGYKNISSKCIIEKNVKLDRINKKGVKIGDYTLVAANSVILSHSHVKRNRENSKLPLCVDTTIGSNCFIGIGSIIMPGINIGNNVIIGEGSVVTRDIPNNCIAVGNPCRVKKENVKIGKYGIIEENL